jgi:UDP-3-O-[3-hydroxymyristoyl] glucosamine N-acyltransferase
MSFTLSQLARETGCSVHGNGECRINSLCLLQEGRPGAIGFISSTKYTIYLQDTQAEAVILTKDLVESSPIPALITSNPRATYARISSLLYPPQVPGKGIHPTAIIAPSATIAADVDIGAYSVIEANVHIQHRVVMGSHCSIEKDCLIGEHSHLHSNVALYHNCHIGKNCILHSGVVIGADGFGFEYAQEEWLKIQQIGGVRIGNNVEIGACSTVDRGALTNTIIHDGVKLDNHIQIAHNVQIGAHTVLANGVGVAGSAKIGQNCLIGGMVGIRDGVEITDNVMITAMSMVTKSLTKAGSYSSNTPIDDTQTWRKNSARFRHLDTLAKKVRRLENEIKKLKEG